MPCTPASSPTSPSSTWPTPPQAPPSPSWSPPATASTWRPPATPPDDDHIAELTEAWARGHGLDFHTLHLGRDKDVHGFDDLLDDSDATAARFIGLGLPITIRDRAYNRHVDGARRVRSVAEFAAPYPR